MTPERIRWPCRADPERWFTRDRTQLGLAVHDCIRHCPRVEECRATEERPVDGVLGGVLFNVERKVDGKQPAEVRCDSCRIGVSVPTGVCGSTAGARRHRRRGERVCLPCRTAEAADATARRKPKPPRHAGPVDVYEGRRRVLDEALRGIA
jgi:hypothetical protein